MALILFLPGMLCDGRVFGPLPERLRGRAEMLIADLDRDSSIEAMARRAIGQLGGRPATIVGFSLGGIVAMEMARLSPASVSHLILMATNHQAATADFVSSRRAMITRVRQGAFGPVVDEMAAGYGPDRQPLPPDQRSLVDVMAGRAGPAAFVAQAEALITRRDQRDTLAAFAGTLSILCGANDSVCPPDLHRAMAQLNRRARLDVVPGCGHLPDRQMLARLGALIGCGESSAS